MLLNLYSNAIKFSRRKGSIIFMIEKKVSDVIVSVIDNGYGIKEKNKDKLFKLFGSIKDEKKGINMQGIGLGLVISKLIV